MDEQRYGRVSSAAGRESDNRPVAPVDDVSVVPTRQPDLTPRRTVAPPVSTRDPAARASAGESTASEIGRSRLRAVERSGDERSRRDPVGTAVETVGAA